jgi:hypothetical protein
MSQSRRARAQPHSTAARASEAAPVRRRSDERGMLFRLANSDGRVGSRCSWCRSAGGHGETGRRHPSRDPRSVHRIRRRRRRPTNIAASGASNKTEWPCASDALFNCGASVGGRANECRIDERDTHFRLAKATNELASNGRARATLLKLRSTRSWHALQHLACLSRHLVLAEHLIFRCDGLCHRCEVAASTAHRVRRRVESDAQ